MPAFSNATSGTGRGLRAGRSADRLGAGWFVVLRHSDMLFAAAPVMVVDGQRRDGHALRHPGNPAGT